MQQKLAAGDTTAFRALRGPGVLGRVWREGRALTGKAVLAVTDQGLFSGANFVVNVLLARWLTPAEYGAYSLAYAVFLLFSSLHSAVLVEPMMVFGSGRYRARFGTYLRRLLGMHFAVSLPSTLVLAAVALALGRVYSAQAARAFFGLVLGAAFILLFWLVRRTPYVLVRPQAAVRGAAIYAAALIPAVAVLKLAGFLSAANGFLAMAAAGAVASAVMLLPFASGWRRTRDSEPPFARVASDHWGYGKWAAGSAAIGWFPGHVYYALLPAWLGLEAAGALRALMNFAMPVAQAVSAISMLLLPALVRDRAAGDPVRMRRTMIRYLALFGAGSASYALLLWLFRNQAFAICYGGKYSEYSGWPLFLAGLMPAGTCLGAVLGSGLRALERPDCMFWCQLVSVGAAVAAGFPMAAAFGVTGALAGITVSSALAVTAMWLFYRRSLAKSFGTRKEVKA